MTWFKVDDKFWSHKKTRTLTDAAVALWVRAGSYCGDHLTDGVVEHGDVEFVGGSKAAAEELVRAGLWLEHDRGYEFHDWDNYQPTRSKVEQEREQTRERVKRMRDAKKNESSSLPVPSRPLIRVTNGVSNGVSNGVTPTPPSVSERMAELRDLLGNENTSATAREAHRAI
ncbi:MAG: hypothetical protein ACKOAF_05015 [Actinomycetes bacterium]